MPYALKRIPFVFLAVGLALFLSLFNGLFIYRELNAVRDDVRIVNSAGIIRGSMQRYVKLGLAHADEAASAAAKTVDEIFTSFFRCEEGFDIGATDSAFFVSLTRLQAGWEELKDLMSGYPEPISEAEVLSFSEECWTRSNDMVLAAQLFSQEKLRRFKSSFLFFFLNVILLFVGVWFIHRYIQKKLKNLADTDALTGILNRRSFQSIFDVELERCNRYGKVFSFIIFDIDHFKKVNDTFGHKTGDRVLKTVAESVQGILRKTDKLCRVGGEEFGIVCPETKLTQAVSLAERCRAVVENEVHVEESSITISVGVGEYQGSESGDAFYKRVDAAMYRAKKMGRNAVAT